MCPCTGFPDGSLNCASTTAAVGAYESKPVPVGAIQSDRPATEEECINRFTSIPRCLGDNGEHVVRPCPLFTVVQPPLGAGAD